MTEIVWRGRSEVIPAVSVSVLENDTRSRLIIRRPGAGSLAITFSYVALVAICGIARAQVFTVETNKIESRYTDIKRT